MAKNMDGMKKKKKPLWIRMIMKLTQKFILPASFPKKGKKRRKKTEIKEKALNKALLKQYRPSVKVKEEKAANVNAKADVPEMEQKKERKLLPDVVLLLFNLLYGAEPVQKGRNILLEKLLGTLQESVSAEQNADAPQKDWKKNLIEKTFFTAEDKMKSGVVGGIKSTIKNKAKQSVKAKAIQTWKQALSNAKETGKAW